MKRSKFTDSQIIDAVNKVESGVGVPNICSELWVSTATFYECLAKYCRMDVSMVSCIKEFEEKNWALLQYPLEGGEKYL